MLIYSKFNKRIKSEIKKLDKKIHCKYLAIEFYDEEHLEWEERFLMLGLSNKLNLLLICHCYRESTGNIRIISAREATKNESKHYYRR